MRIQQTPATPMVHLNGTTADNLIAGYEVATMAIAAAIDAVKDTAPHARDYHCQSPQALRRAEEEHLERLAKLTAVLEELNSIAVNVMEQRDEQVRCREMGRALLKSEASVSG